MNTILRGVILVLGLVPEAQKPGIGDPLPPGGGDTWGLGDSQIQIFFSPKSDSAWKWGAGPLVSLPTHTDSKLKGAGWGGGLAAVLVGSITEEVSLSLVGGHIAGQNDYSSSFVQPMLYYNVPGVEGVAISYNNTIFYNHNATSGNEWTVPLGMGISKTFVLQSGMGIDTGIGYYYNVEKPTGAPDWTLKWSVAIIFP